MLFCVEWANSNTYKKKKVVGIGSPFSSYEENGCNFVCPLSMCPAPHDADSSNQIKAHACTSDTDCTLAKTGESSMYCAGSAGCRQKLCRRETDCARLCVERMSEDGSYGGLMQSDFYKGGTCSGSESGLGWCNKQNWKNC